MDISVVIITYNCWNFLQKCLRSIYEKIKGGEFEVIVIDNNSIDGTRNKIKIEFANIELVENDRNMGVANARNQGIQMAKGRYILIIDADAEIISSNIHELVMHMDNHKEIGILGCTLLSEDRIIHSSARTFPRPIHVLLRRLSQIGLVKDCGILKKHHLADWDRKTPRRVDFVEGAFQLIRKEAVDKVGLLDSRMFYGFEDADYCARMMKAGYQVVCYPSFYAGHYLQGITRKNPFNKMVLRHLMSYIRFYLKHRGLILGK